MNLSFSTKFPARKKDLAGKPTYFVEKIHLGMSRSGVWNSENHDSFEKIMDECEEKGFLNVEYWNKIFDDISKSKIHTIRRDENGRWKKGNYIHFNINSRTKDQFNFAPVIQCTGKEQIKIVYWMNSSKPIVMINDIILNRKAIEQLAFNDGFDSIEDFFSWFDSDFEGWIIHWTLFRYEVNEIEVNAEIIPGHTQDQLDKIVGDGIAKAIGGKVVTYGNKNLDNKQVDEQPNFCQETFDEKVCDECEFNNSRTGSHPGGSSVHSVDYRFCDLGHWDENF